MSLVLIGAGGHALVVLDAALSGSLPVAGLVDQVVPAGQMIGSAPDVYISGSSDRIDIQQLLSAQEASGGITTPGMSANRSA